LLTLTNSIYPGGIRTHEFHLLLPGKGSFSGLALLLREASLGSAGSRPGLAGMTRAGLGGFSTGSRGGSGLRVAKLLPFSGHLELGVSLFLLEKLFDERHFYLFFFSCCEKSQDESSRQLRADGRGPISKA
jgi:hypothetical protein